MYKLFQLVENFPFIPTRISAWFFPQPLETEYNHCLHCPVLLGVGGIPISRWMGNLKFVFQDPWASPYCSLQNIFVKFICKCHAE